VLARYQRPSKRRVRNERQRATRSLKTRPTSVVRAPVRVRLGPPRKVVA
jgi:hypothetical protein